MRRETPLPHREYLRGVVSGASQKRYVERGIYPRSNLGEAEEALGCFWKANWSRLLRRLLARSGDVRSPGELRPAETKPRLQSREGRCKSLGPALDPLSHAVEESEIRTTARLRLTSI